MYLNQLNYLFQKDESIRNQLIPANVDQDLFFEAIRKYFRTQFEKGNNLSYNQNLEIEIKLGQFISKDSTFENMLNNFKFISKYHHIFLTEFSQYYTFQPCFILPPWTDQLKYDCISFPQSYQNLINYFRNLDKNNQTYKNIYQMYIDPQNCQPMSKQEYGLRLDLVLQNGQRISIYNDGRKEMQQKQRLENIDIMKNVMQYRLTTNIETKTQLPNDFDDFIQNQQFRTVRFKQYQLFQYQFLEISMSRVLQINSSEIQELINYNKQGKNIKWQNVLNILVGKLFDVNRFEKDNFNQKESYLSNNRKCEVEFEVHDLQYFQQNITTFSRMQRNIDSFFQTDRVTYDILYSQIKTVNPKANRFDFSPPLIGNYLVTVYNSANKQLIK